MQLTALSKHGWHPAPPHGCMRRVFIPKLLLVMKLAIFLLTVACLQVSARGYTQRVTLDVQNASLEKVFKEIRKQTGYNFLFSSDELQQAKKVTIRVKNAPVDEVLSLCFKDQPLAYTMVNGNIVVKPLPAPVFPMMAPVRSSWPVKGKVTNEQGEPLSGVNIKIKGSRLGTTTNGNGEFNIDIPDNTSSILIFSFVGMQMQEIDVAKRSEVNIILRIAAVSGTEVIVVGYGTQSKRNVSGSIATISDKDIKDMAVTGVDKAIQGKAPGVMVTNNNGEPGAGVTIRIRGTTSIGSGNDPLYIIDGIPLENTQTANVNVGESRVNGMSQINPADIQSIQILKDAAATSIYGARAANGVVLITTKRGVLGKNEFSLDYSAGLATVTNRYDLLGASDYAILVNEGRKQLAASQPQYSPVFSDEFIKNPSFNTNWQDEIFRTAITTNINASLRGGSNNTKYMFSGGYTDQQGVLIGTGFKRYNVRANIDSRISDKFNIGTNVYAAFINQSRSKNDGGPAKGESINFNNLYGSPVLTTALVKSPASPVLLADGTYAMDTLQQDYANPVRQALAVDINTNVTRIIATAFAEYKILQQLTFKSQLSGDLRSENEKWFNPPNPNFFPGSSDGEGQASRRTFDQKFWNFENYLTYTGTFSKAHNFSLLLGNSMQQTNWEESFVLVGGITTPDIPTLNAGTIINIARSNIEYYGIVSYFSRLNYDYDGKYLVSLNARYDGSSRFGKNNRFGFFPSASIGWRISQEPFMQSVTAINDLKARVSYGVTGNQEIANYAARGMMSIGGGTNFGNNYTGSTGATINSLPSPNLKWESTAQLNVGIDLGIFNNRLGFTVDYYKKNTNDLLFAVPLPATRGIGYILDNIGEVENKGIELNINAVIIKGKKFSWNTDLNISGNRNKVVSLRNNADVIAGDQFTGYSIARVGQPISFLLYQREKLVDPQTGRIQIVDQDNSGGIPNEKDRIIAGTPFPDFFGGWTNSFSYGPFDVAAFLQFSHGNKIYNLTRAYMERQNLTSKNIIGPNTTVKAFKNRWQKPGDITEYPKPDYDGLGNLNSMAHDGWLEDGSYLRLKSVTVGYNFPPSFLSKRRLKSIRLALGANNLLTFTRYTGLDPEVNSFTGVNGGANSGLRQGYDYGSYPASKSFTAGFTIIF